MRGSGWEAVEVVQTPSHREKARQQQASMIDYTVRALIGPLSCLLLRRLIHMKKTEVWRWAAVFIVVPLNSSPTFVKDRGYLHFNSY